MTIMQSPAPTSSPGPDRPSPENGHDPGLAHELTRVLLLAAGGHGELLVTPSSTHGEKVHTAYHFPPRRLGRQGHDRDTVAIKLALLAKLVELGHPATRAVPGGDVAELQPVRITSAGLDWLLANREHGVPVELGLSHCEAAPARPRWNTVSWRPQRACPQAPDDGLPAPTEAAA